MTQPQPPGTEFVLPPAAPKGRYLLPANGLQRMGLLIAFFGIGTPFYWVVLRIVTKNGGWLAFIYIAFLSWLFVFAHILALIPVAIRFSRTIPAAGGPVSTPLMLTAIIAHASTALFIGDFGDMSDSITEPLVTRLFGLDMDIAYVLGLGIGGIGILALAGAIVMACVECEHHTLAKKAEGFVPSGTVVSPSAPWPGHATPR